MTDFVQQILDARSEKLRMTGESEAPVKPWGGACIESSMGTHSLFDASREDLAWEDYRQLALALVANPKLLLDRPFMGLFARTERRWKHIYTTRCACQEASGERF